MAIGERIRFIRNLRGMTQKYLGTLVGFPEKTADIRMAQYEAGTRTPKEDLTKALAGALEVSPLALDMNTVSIHLLNCAKTVAQKFNNFNYFSLLCFCCALLPSPFLPAISSKCFDFASLHM